MARASRQIYAACMLLFGAQTLCCLLLLLVLNDNVYTCITVPLWSILPAVSLICFGIIIYQILKKCTDYWEESLNGIAIK